MAVVENRPCDTDAIDADEKEESEREDGEIKEKENRREKDPSMGRVQFSGLGPRLGLDWVEACLVCVALLATAQEQGENVRMCRWNQLNQIMLGPRPFSDPCQRINPQLFSQLLMNGSDGSDVLVV